MSLLEDGADYLRLGSAWQQRLAFAVKAGALTSYLNCSMLNEDAADVDVLMAWLEDALGDPIQMADTTLASVVLRCLALVGKISPALAPSLSRLLPRFIVQGNPRGRTVAVASTCLAYVLRMLSQDAIITTLYTLGNVLSSGSNAEKALSGATTGDFAANVDGLYGSKQGTGSAISLAIIGEEETLVVYSNVIKAICSVASSCNDDKIVALAQSMLLQKIQKVNLSVDACIITETAVLALSGGPLEFKSLLKLYMRVTQEGVATSNAGLLASVSIVIIDLLTIADVVSGT
jgi:phosphatidylinositol 4-kinase